MLWTRFWLGQSLISTQLEDLIENLQVKTEPEQLVNSSKKSKTSISNGVVISDKYPINTELNKSKMRVNSTLNRQKKCSQS